ncbi:unnamed protein product [Rotaria sp. Silwood1]|nr:unnamed protein product [Rotaria sp. Silwood1]CAF3716478.1 unnamed protein product [Rotaria sp. Silwood1]CAF4875660.1 unnamed protein product [Rotaria sp. Silwood1]
MANIDIIQTRDFTKLSYLENQECTVSKVNEHKKCISLVNDISKKEEDIIEKKYSLNESESLRQVRIRSLSHWLHITPSLESMISAGWFSCNVSDRVICIYCNTICQGWTINDDPIEVHRRFAPQCPFVLSMSSIENSPKIINENFNEKFQPIHPKMAEISHREATFTKLNWTENLPTIENLVRAGFFFGGIENAVTCFYCNGSLHKWSSNDNPIIEHARWFPQCTYAKHLCGDDLYKKIQQTKKRIIKQNNNISDNELRQMISARLDLPIVEQLRSQYRLEVIKRCIEDQLKIKHDDFLSDLDLSIACLILQKQIDHIKGCQDKIIIPSKKLQQLENLSLSMKQSFGECLICLTEEKQLACMPCGHLCACVPCGYALKSCPICRQKIQSFMRINN